MIACRACRAFVGETAIGDTALCYLCAHAVAVHGETLDMAPYAQCEHTAAEIYPPDVLRARAATEPSPELVRARADLARILETSFHPVQVRPAPRGRLSGIAVPRARRVR